ncbi:unnamed protein product [Urochloa humidicola]
MPPSSAPSTPGRHRCIRKEEPDVNSLKPTPPLTPSPRIVSTPTSGAPRARHRPFFTEPARHQAPPQPHLALRRLCPRRAHWISEDPDFLDYVNYVKVEEIKDYTTGLDLELKSDLIQGLRASLELPVVKIEDGGLKP